MLQKAKIKLLTMSIYAVLLSPNIHVLSDVEGSYM